MANTNRATVNETNSNVDGESATATGNTLASMYAEQANIYTKVVNGYTIPVRPKYKEGDVLTAATARALNTYRLERSSATANSNVTRGTLKDKSDAEKIEAVTKYLDEQDPGEDAGSVWHLSLLQQAVQNILVASNPDKFAGFTASEIREAAAPFVNTILNDPARTERYAEQVKAEMAAILAKRHEIAKRDGTKSDKSKLDLEF